MFGQNMNILTILEFGCSIPYDIRKKKKSVILGSKEKFICNQLVISKNLGLLI